MSEILKIFTDNMIKDRPTWWLILDCHHWYHWTGDSQPKNNNLNCPDCKPPIVIKRLSDV